MTRPRVLSHPPRHPYVDRLHGRAATLVHRDEPSDRLHDPAWIMANAAGWDIVHLHLGPDDHDPQTVLDALDAHRAAGVPIAVTVHDLQTPHLHPDRDRAVDLLQAIAPVASALTTITSGCAREVHRLTGRSPQVIPHGPLVPAGRRHRLRAHRRLALSDGHILVNAGMLRPNLGLAELADACRAVRPTLPVRIQVHRRSAEAVNAQVGGIPGIEVVVHDGLTHAELERSVADAAALLLPLRWGTHSGLLEVAADVGTPVLTTSVGFLSEQPHTVPGGHARTGIAVTDDRVDVTALALAISRPLHRAPVVLDADRDRDEATFTTLHDRLYHRLLTFAVAHRRAA